MLAESKLHEG